MASKIFLDANILLDYALNRQAYQQAKQILEMAVSGEVQAFTTASVVHITGHWLAKEFGTAFSKKILLTILLDVKVIDIPHETVIAALSSQINDIEDSLQYYAAIHYNIDYFISRDKQLKKNGIPLLPVYTPEEFIQDFS